MSAPDDKQLAQVFNQAVDAQLFGSDVDLIRVRAFSALVRHRAEYGLCVECAKTHPCPTVLDLTTGVLG